MQHKATHMTIICSKCKNTKVISCKPGLGGAQFPRYCDAGAEAELGADNCGQDPYVILPNKSRFSDLQTLKLQVWNPQAYSSSQFSPAHVWLDAQSLLQRSEARISTKEGAAFCFKQTLKLQVRQLPITLSRSSARPWETNLPSVSVADFVEHHRMQ